MLYLVNPGEPVTYLFIILSEEAFACFQLRTSFKSCPTIVS